MNARRFKTRDELLSILGLASGSSDEVVKRAYKGLVKIYHPDMAGGTSQKFQEITDAYDALMAKNYTQTEAPPPKTERTEKSDRPSPLTPFANAPDVRAPQGSPDVHIPFNLGESQRPQTNVTGLLVLSLVIAGAIYLALAKAILYFEPVIKR
jgi:hypothetical protein